MLIYGRIAGLVVGLGLASLGPGFARAAEAETLQPQRLPGMCLSMNAGGVVESQPCDGSAAQEFDLPVRGAAKAAPMRQDGLCLAPVGGGYYPPVSRVACDGSPAQAWTMSLDGEMRTGAGRCLSLLGYSSRSGEMVFAGDCPKQGEGQSWTAKQVAPDFAKPIEASFESVARPGKCIGYDTGLALYDCTDAYRQLFSFNSKEMGQMRMMSSCLVGGFAFGTVTISGCYDGKAAQWAHMDSGVLANGNIRCVEVSPENGRDVLREKPCTFTPEQKWVMRKG